MKLLQWLLVVFFIACCLQTSIEAFSRRSWYYPRSYDPATIVAACRNFSIDTLLIGFNAANSATVKTLATALNGANIKVGLITLQDPRFSQARLSDQRIV